MRSFIAPIFILFTLLTLIALASPNDQCDSKAEMSCQDHSKIALYTGGILVVGLGIGYFVGLKLAQRKERCNRKHKLDMDKIVDTVDMEDIGEKKVFCRCWKSSKFPYCDGSHNAHNKETCDNVGPLIVKGASGKQD